MVDQTIFTRSNQSVQDVRDVRNVLLSGAHMSGCAGDPKLAAALVKTCLWGR